MLAMKIANGDCPISGRNTNRSRISPNRMHASSVSTMPARNGIWTPNFGAPSVKVQSSNAPITSTSPCAILTILEAR